MRRYDSYKNSGIEWIGQVPGHWDVGRLKFTGRFENGLTYSPNDISDDSGILVLRSSNIQSYKLDFHDCVYVANVPKELMIENGDIIICSRNGSPSLIGKCAYIDCNITATYGAFMMRYRPIICKKFAFYLFQSAISYYKGLFATTTINQLTKVVVNQMNIPIVPLSEQQAIASYLDKQCENIDKAITQQQRMIDLLNERKQIIIQQAVTKGLNPNVKMKDSCNNVIGDIPQQWQIMPIKYVATFLNGYAFNSNAFNSNDNGIPVIRIGDITEEGIMKEELVYVDENPKLNPFKILCGDILIAMSGATTGKVCCVKAEDGGYINQRVGIIRGNNNSWIMYCLKSLLFRKYVDLCAYGSAQPNISASGIMNFKICLPPQDERKEIILYLEKEETKIDSIIVRCNRQIALLKERKQIIINEAVTGKIKVV